MKKFKKLFALMVSAALVATFSTAALAAPNGTVPGTGTITITPPSNATGENTYEIYKVFDATVSADKTKVAYKLLAGCKDTDVPAGFTAKNGYITDAPKSLDESASAIAAYTKKELVDTVTTTGATSKASEPLKPGYYYISTSTGAAVMVQDGANVTVADKNVLSSVKKSAGEKYSDSAKKAIAAVGTDQPFTAVITKGHGATKLVFSDTMTNMTYNGDVVVTYNGSTVSPGTSTFSVNGAEGDGTFTVTFVDNYVKGLPDNAEITLNYTAKVTSDALSANPAKNEAKLVTDNDFTSTSEVEVYNAKLKIYKQDGDTKEPLPGAGFVIAKGEDYYKNENGVVSWVKSLDDASEYTSGQDGYLSSEFTGLGAGTYTVIEKTVPDGYNKVDDSTVTISESGYTTADLEKIATASNMQGAELPSTGGIGTTIFYIIGSILVIGAGVLLVTKKRMDA